MLFVVAVVAGVLVVWVVVASVIMTVPVVVGCAGELYLSWS